jgi:hypothetical protein
MELNNDAALDSLVKPGCVDLPDADKLLGSRLRAAVQFVLVPLSVSNFDQSVSTGQNHQPEHSGATTVLTVNSVNRSQFCPGSLVSKRNSKALNQFRTPAIWLSSDFARAHSTRWIFPAAVRNNRQLCPACRP